MAGFIPGLLPTNHSQEKEFAQAYEDVLERYKGKEEWGGSCGSKFPIEINTKNNKNNKIRY